MGLIVRTFECEACSRRFDVYQERDELPPDACPFCPASEESTITGPIPSTTAIGERRISKSVDATYRAAEEGSQIRAEAFDDPAMKITNMKDNLRQGEVAAITPSNVVSQFVGGQYTDGQQHSFWGAGGAPGAPSSVNPGMTTQALVRQAAMQRAPGEEAPGASALRAIQGEKMHTRPPPTQNVNTVTRQNAGFGGGFRRG